MRKILQKALASLLCLVLVLSLAPMALAADASGYRARHYDEDIIVGFQSPDAPLVIDTEYKYALIELRKQFPAELTVFMGGTVFYEQDEGESISIHHIEPAVTESVAVTWKCTEDYDEDLDVFHFVPALDEEHLADSVELPVITVHVLGALERPPMPVFEDVPDYDVIPSGDFGTTVEGVLPIYYNNFENGVLPPIRNQSPFGTCWAFSTIAAAEADLIHDGIYDTSVDLSELHLAYYNYHDFYDEKVCNIGDTVRLNGADYLNAGGSPTYGTLDLANLIGPVQEADVPYSLGRSYQPGPDEGRSGTLQILSIYRCPLSNPAVVKQAIIDHGAVTASYDDQDQFYSATYNSYYLPTSNGTNHCVAIVGWDDNFPRNNFRGGTPEGDGAWLIRNSWGVNSYNHGGYFWLSYYDKGLYQTASALDVAPTRYQHIYSYDNVPPMWTWTVESGSAIEQEFHIDGGEEIQAVGVYCPTPNASLTLTVVCGNVSSEATINAATPGYYVAPLSSPMTIVETSDVTVQYIINGSVDQVSVSGEGPGTFRPYIDKTYYNIYYIAECGSGLIANGDLKTKDARIKLFTNDMSEFPVPDFGLPDDLRSIGAEAFSGSFSYAWVPENQVSIGPRAFANCPNLLYIHIPAQVKDISENAFEGLTGLTILGVDGSTAETYARNHGLSFMSITDFGSGENADDSNG